MHGRVRSDHGFARRLRGGARRATLAVCLLGIALPALPTPGLNAQVPAQLPAPAVAQPAGDADAVKRLITEDADRLVASTDPVVRGEAALVLAATGDPSRHAAILAVAKDKEPEARIRGLIALGMLGAPGSDRVLADAIDDSMTRPRSEGLAAAFALGLLQPDSAPSEVTRCLNRFLQSNYRRQHDLLAALLTGLVAQRNTPQREALLRLLDDAANKDGVLRALLLRTLGQLPDALDGRRMQSVLERGTPEERLALLTLLRDTQQPDERALIPFAVRLCGSDPSPAVRAASLAFLTRLRHLPALDLAAKALKAGNAVEVAQGARSALQLGGNSMRLALEQHITDSAPQPLLQAAMLQAFAGAMSEAFADTCLRLGADRKQPFELRVAAALALARAGQERCAPELRDLFLDAQEPAQLQDLARAIARLEKDPPELSRLHPGDRPEDLLRAPARLQALVAAGHAGAMRFVLEHLTAKGTETAQRAMLLRVWRQAIAPLAGERVQMLPATLQKLYE